MTGNGTKTRKPRISKKPIMIDGLPTYFHLPVELRPRHKNFQDGDLIMPYRCWCFDCGAERLARRLGVNGLQCTTCHGGRIRNANYPNAPLPRKEVTDAGQ